jgi:hypothetical protein
MFGLNILHVSRGIRTFKRTKIGELPKISIVHVRAVILSGAHAVATMPDAIPKAWALLLRERYS